MNKKIIAFILAGMMLVSVGAPVRAEEVTIESLQQQIAELTAIINTLQARLAGQTSTPSTGAVCFHTDLEQGMTSAEVLKLQQTLNLDPATKVATSGAGAPGSETTYFGPLTLAAVKAFQAKHGIITTGYVGPLTRAQLNALYCTPTTPTTIPDETSTTTTTTLAGAEGTLSVTTAPVYTETLLKWGTPNQTIYGFKVKAMNSDINLKRIFVKLSADDGGLIPWKDLNYISLYDGDNAIKGIEVNSANLVENTYAEDYDVYFDGLNIVVPKGSEKTFTVKVTTPSYPENRTAFTITLPANGVRGLDAAGLNQYNSSGVPGKGKTVDYEGSRSTGALQIRNNSTTPQMGVILGSETEVTQDVPIFKFDVKATLNDVTLKKAAINLTQSDEGLISAVYLFDGDNRLASVAASSTDTESQVITFPDLSINIAKDATKTLTVKVDLAKIDEDLEGSSISDIATAANNTFSVIDANDNNVTSITGNASGHKQTVYTAAPVFALIETPILAQDPNTSTQAVATFKVSVTGYGDTIYMSSTTAFTLESSDIDMATTTKPDIRASKSPNGNVYEIGPGETVNFTVEAAVKKVGSGGLASVSIKNIQWGQSIASSTEMNGSDAFDFMDYKTNSVNFY